MAQKLHGEVARPPRLLWKLKPAVHDVGHPFGLSVCSYENSRSACTSRLRQNTLQLLSRLK
eukprot:1924606-Rhodomonas_salina.1